MQRCLQLAKLGAGQVAPNPMVGAVLVYQDRIIGEGYHQQFGQAHAEVNCIKSVSEHNQPMIEKSTLYVSLEPCAHYGKTPPCADLIIKNKIPDVVIACRDSYEEVDGKGIQKLQQAGVNVTVGILEKEAQELNKAFFTFYAKKRPYIILKWAQSKDNNIAHADYSLLKISNDITDRLVHKWRSEAAAILVATNTALHDNPALTNRLWSGNNPTRLIIDKQLKLPATMHVFDGSLKTVVFNFLKEEEKDGLMFYKLAAAENIIPGLLAALYKLKVQRVLVEGGSRLLQSFIDAGSWDEARIITNELLITGDGIKAPQLKHHRLIGNDNINSDSLAYYENTAK